MEINAGDYGVPLRHLTSRSSSTIKTGYQRYERPVYDHATKYAPCRAECPAGHDIAWAIQMAARGRFDLALHAFKEDSPFPAITGRVCYHPCEQACNRAEYDQPLAINALERSFAEYGNGDLVEPAPRLYNESIGVVGAGPAGLACAYHLVRLGYPVTVYDANELPGGALAYAIPPYRLPREVLRREIDALSQLGVEFHCGVRVGVDVTFDHLQETHHALFLAPGLARARTLSIPVPNDPRVQSGLDFLRAVGRGTSLTLAGHVAIIGGGDVAVDTARCALRLGADKVTLCCPEARTDMPAHAEEVDAARHEGIEILDRVAPCRLEAAGKHLYLTLAQVRGMERNPEGNMVLQLDEKGQRTLSISYLVYAVGQEADLSFLPHHASRQRKLPVSDWGQTTLPGVFAGGDITGTYNVVNAIGSAKRAAIGIDAWLRGLDMSVIERHITVGQEGTPSMRAYHAARQGELSPPIFKSVGIQEINLDYFPPAERMHVSEGNPIIRGRSFVEVVHPLSRTEAVAEAQRCFNCGTCNMCGNCFRFCPDSSVLQLEDWGFTIDLDHCKGCGICVEECPRCAMSMMPEWELARDDVRL